MITTHKIKTYEDLIDIVNTFDVSAARYLDTEARKMDDFDEHYDLSYCFTWNNTPQGFRYWDNVSSKVYKFKKSGQVIPKRSIIPEEFFSM